MGEKETKFEVVKYVPQTISTKMRNRHYTYGCVKTITHLTSLATQMSWLWRSHLTAIEDAIPNRTNLTTSTVHYDVQRATTTSSSAVPEGRVNRNRLVVRPLRLYCFLSRRFNRAPLKKSYGTPFCSGGPSEYRFTSSEIQHPIWTSF